MTIPAQPSANGGGAAGATRAAAFLDRDGTLI